MSSDILIIFNIHESFLVFLLTHWGKGMDKERLSNESYRTGL